MNFAETLITFFETLSLNGLFTKHQSPLILEQKALKKWREPHMALEKILKLKNPSLPLLQATCLLWIKLVENKPEDHIVLLRDILQRLPMHARATTLVAVNDNDFTRVASLLILLVPFRLEGFTELAIAIQDKWDQQGKFDNLALAFIQIIEGYGVSPWRILSSQARILIERRQYQQVEQLFAGVIVRLPHPPADLYWHFISLEQQVMRPAPKQIEVLQDFVNKYPADQRLGLAWQKMGDLYGNVVDDYQKALAAYFKAEQHGSHVPQLQAYRSGDWSTIAALQKHEDYAFPPVVVIDLEVDPSPGAARGSRVFEIAAVRYKGKTCVEQYSSYIQRNFIPKKWNREVAVSHLKNALTADIIAQKLQQFIGNAFVIGHNLRAFDALELEGMGVSIEQARIVDSLELARLLHPDSIRHHLALLCQRYGVVVDKATLHSALPDAQACAALFHALGDSLAQRESTLVAGIRALVLPESAFDKAILQPRHIPADPTLPWDIDASPGIPMILTPLRGNQSSQAMQSALEISEDQFIEHTDFDARYIRSLPINEHSLVTVGTRTRIEHMLTDYPQPQQLFVLPHMQTLLCPDRMRRAIEACETSEQKLRLFCLYQASHNHDAGTLYPLRLPPEALDTPELLILKQTLVKACCSSDEKHTSDCPAAKTVQKVLDSYPLLLSTHEIVLQQPAPLVARTIIIDDAADLQMNLAEYSAETLKSSQVRNRFNSPLEQSALQQFEVSLQEQARRFLPNPGYHERLPLSSLFPALATTHHSPILTTLKQAGKIGEEIINWIENLCTKAASPPQSPAVLHAFWVDLWFEQNSLEPRLREWCIAGFSQDVREIFHHFFWKPYTRHIIAGPALTTGSRNTRFLERSLGIPAHLLYQQDTLKRKRVVLSPPEIIPPTGFLQRRKWIMQVGAFIASIIYSQQRAILVTLNNKIAEAAFIQAFMQTGETAQRQLLAPQLHWTISKINERMNDPQRRSIVFASPRLRHTLLDGTVDVEISGPLRFLDKRDPLVIAQMHVFAQLYPENGPFAAYLLPQALLELKTRFTSNANEYIICDGGLLSKSYRDEVLQLLAENADVYMLEAQMNHGSTEQFLETLRTILVHHGLDNQASVTDADLQLILQSIWGTDTFRFFPPLEESSSAISQKAIVQAALAGKDQLVIAATGGGKSLCFQLPSIVLAEESSPLVTLVFSPLIALMSNQIEHLNQKGIFSAIMLNSTLSFEQRQEHLEGIKKGYYSIIYLAPEQIHSKKVCDALQHREIGLVAIDEVHCLSQWGHNFRTDYFAIKKWLDRVLCHNQRREFPILALTATARKGYRDSQNAEQSDQASTVTDIIEKLGLRISEDDVVLSSTVRPELDFYFEYVTPIYICTRCKQSYEYQMKIGACPSCGYLPQTRKNEVQHTITELKKQKLLALLGSDAQKKTSQLPDLCLRWSQPFGTRQRGLIYCAYQKTTVEIANFLKENIPDLRIGTYHAGMDSIDRDTVLRRFTSNAEQGFDVVVCTNAFGMGIDVRRLGFVIHFDTPATPEAYYQEAGRAGRDSLFREGREQAQCILLFHPLDLEKQRFLSGQNSFADYEIEDVYQVICQIYARNQEHPLQINMPDLQNISVSNNNPRQVFASAQEIAERAGVKEDQVNTLLYYLEYQTKDKINHRPVLERGAFASNIWQLRFESTYEQKIQGLPASSRSQSLLKLFQDSDAYRLSTDHFTTIPAREITEILRLSLENLERELLNLVQRGVIHYAGSGQFKLHYPIDTCKERLVSLEKDLRTLFSQIYEASKKEFGRDGRVTVNLRSLMARQNISTFTFPQFTHFLFKHSLESSEPSRLLEHFQRVTRNGQPENYELQLWLNRKSKSPFPIIQEIIASLKETLDVLSSRMKNGVDKDDWYAIDLFDAELHFPFSKRKIFHQHLFLLQTLGLLKYMSDPAMGQAMHLTLLQPPVPLEQLEVDLQSLRLQENHAKSKRKLMEQYATVEQKEHYVQQFSLYFQGKEPLLVHGTQELRTDLMPEQRQLAMLKEGIHVIQGPAGCGKTTILVEHVKYLVNQGVPIDHIMVTTQYTSAEGHIADALKELTVEGATTISTTINAFGNKIFTQYRHLLPKPDDTPYYSQAQPPQVIKSRNEREEELPYINQTLKEVKARNFALRAEKQGWPWPSGIDFPSFSREYQSNAVEEDLFQAAIYRFRQYGIFPTIPPTKDELLSILAGLTGSFTAAEFYAVYATYIEIQAEHNQYTFDDQIVFALAILRKNPDILREYQRYYEHIIIDELQDFSPAKVELLMLLCEKRSNIMAFGDLYQEVTFEKNKPRENGDILKVKIAADKAFAKLLQQDHCYPQRGHQVMFNFRSTQEILDFTSSLRNPRIRLQSAQGKHGPKPIFITVPSNATSDMLAVALEQIELLSATEKESIALIFGNKIMLQPAQEFLQQQNIPFSLMDGGKTLYQLHHVRNLLLYFYLIVDKTRDDDVERLLRQNIVPYFERGDISHLKASANKHGLSLFDFISSPEHLREAKIDAVRVESVLRHTTIIRESNLNDAVHVLEQALRELPDGPITLLQNQEKQLEDIEEILKDFNSLSIHKAIEQIERHVTFLKQHQGRTDLILATVAYAKSQEFETVFLLGLDKVFDKRLYVSVSRAKQRLFLLGDSTSFTNNRALSQISEKFYMKQ